VGAPSFSIQNPYGLYNTYCADEFASQYPNIRPIVHELMTIKAKAIDSNGKSVPHPALDALYHPNRTDSYVLFMEKLGVSVLSLDYTYLLVWRTGSPKAKATGDFTPRGQNIAGFTFLENPAITYLDGKVYYNIGSQRFSEDEVIAIPGGAKPGNLYGGYSPARSSAKWSTVDGYIGDYQKGFFENNAIPAGMFRVTAPTPKDYEDTVERLKEKHRGAGNNNNVTYSYVPMDENGKGLQPVVEWIPFSQSNKDIDFKNLLDHVDNRLSEAYGVSSIIKGVDSAAKYSNAEVSEANFAKRAVNPLALRIFSQITHELNRITGGLGVALTYEYEIPAVADAEKVKAETKSIESQIILKYTSDPYNWSLNSVVDAFNLSQSYKLLKKGNDTTVIKNDKPEVDEGDEVDNAPNPNEIDGVTPIEAAKRTNPKAELTDEEKLEKVARDYLEAQVNRAVSELEDEDIVENKVSMAVNPNPTEDELEKFVLAAYAVVLAVLLAEGKEEYAAGVALAGLSLDELQGFTLPETAEDYYQAYLRRVGTSYGSDTAESIQKVLLDARDNGLTRKQTEDALKAIVDTDDYRVKRLARTELNHSQNMGKLEGMKSLASETGTQWEKTIDHSGVTPCPLCQSQEGIWVTIDSPLWAEGETIIAPNNKGEEVIYVNDWQTNEAQDYHPNGRGTLVFRRTEV